MISRSKMLILLLGFLGFANANLLAIGSGSSRPQCTTCDSTSGTSQCASGLTCKDPFSKYVQDHGIGYIEVHNSDCTKDNENHQNYLGSGSAYNTLQKCADACKNIKTPNGKHALGFIYSSVGSACACESQKSHPDPDCTPANLNDAYWKRYDFFAYTHAHHGTCVYKDGHQHYLGSGSAYNTLWKCANHCKSTTLSDLANGEELVGFIWTSGGNACACQSMISHPRCRR